MSLLRLGAGSRTSVTRLQARGVYSEDTGIEPRPSRSCALGRHPGVTNRRAAASLGAALGGVLVSLRMPRRRITSSAPRCST